MIPAAPVACLQLRTTCGHFSMGTTCGPLPSGRKLPPSVSRPWRSHFGGAAWPVLGLAHHCCRAHLRYVAAADIQSPPQASRATGELRKPRPGTKGRLCVRPNWMRSLGRLNMPTKSLGRPPVSRTWRDSPPRSS